MIKKTKSLYNKKSKYYRLIMKMKEKINPDESIMFLKKKIIDALGESKEVRESKKVFFDKKANQFSIKIPKSLALKSGLNDSSIFDLVLKTKKDETLDKIKKSKLVIFLKENDNKQRENSS